MNLKQLLFRQTLLTCFLTTLLSGAIEFPLTSNFRFWILDFGLEEFLGLCHVPCGQNPSKIANLKSSSPVSLSEVEGWAGSIQNRQSKIQNQLTSLKAQAQGFGQPPGTNKSGGVRGGCAAAFEGRQLIALVENGKSTFSKPELTTKEYPTLFFYLPLARNPNFTTKDGQVYSLTSVEFELQDENENPVLKNQKLVFSLPNQPGIVSLKLPISERPLEPNKKYFWVFRIICDRNDNSANPTVAGWIKRVSPGSSDNIWFDRLKNLAESRTNFLDDWTKLLGQFELQNLAQAAIVELQPEAQNN